MSRFPCPITGYCLEYLQAAMRGSRKALFEDSLGTMQELWNAGFNISGEPDYVRMRGFIAIESMLRVLQEIGARGYKFPEDLPPLQLLQRSWGGLTVVLETLLQLADTLKLDNAELRLGGVKATLDWKGALVIPVGVENKSLGQSANLVLRLTELTPLVAQSVTLLRPYLRNPSATVTAIGANLITCLEKHHSEFVVEPIAQVITEFIEVQI